MSNLCANCFLPVIREKTTCAVCDQPLHKDCAIEEGGTFYCDVCFTAKTEEVHDTDYTPPEVIRRSYIETYKSCP